MNIKQMGIKDKEHYSSSDVINLNDFDYDLLKLDKNELSFANIYYVNYNDKHPIYLFIKKIDGFIEESANCENIKYINFAATGDNLKIWIDMIKFG